MRMRAGSLLRGLLGSRPAPRRGTYGRRRQPVPPSSAAEVLMYLVGRRGRRR